MTAYSFACGYDPNKAVKLLADMATIEGRATLYVKMNDPFRSETPLSGLVSCKRAYLKL